MVDFNLEFVVILLIVGFLAGFLGSILGLGGGIIVTPILTLLLGVSIKAAIGASIISVIATSSGATIAFLRDEILNIRVAMFLEIFTTLGALLGAAMTGLFHAEFLFLLFGILLIFQTWNMYRKLKLGEEVVDYQDSDPLATKLKLNYAYFDRASNKLINYNLERVPLGAVIMFGAGVASGLLGIGSGAFKVMAMDSVMKMPLKPSSSTSNLMMGVTASTSAIIYFFNGTINPVVAASLSLGIIGGSLLGSKIMPKIPTKILRLIFIPIIFYLGIQMLLKGTLV
jgi:uncharacterized membrane protein YfcA